MASMNIEMRLNLVDTASEPVKAFMSTLEGLQGAVNGASEKMSAFAASVKEVQTSSKGFGSNFAKIAEGMKAVGTAAGTAGQVNAFAASMERLAGALGLVKENSSGVGSALSNIGNRAGGASLFTAKLEQSLLGLTTALEGVGTKLVGAAAGLEGLGTAAALVRAEAGGAMGAVGAGAQGANEHVNTLAQSLKGMAQLWGALKIEKGIKGSVIDAAEYERTDNRLRNMNLSPSDSAAIHQSVRQAGKDFHQFDQNEYLEMAIDLRNATGSAKEAADGLQSFAKSVFAMNMSMPSGKKLDEQGMLNFAKLLEGRGVTMDPARMEAEQDLVAKIVAATQGRVNPNNLFGNLSYAKGGLGRTMNDEAFKVMAAMIEQEITGGGTGGRTATELTSFVDSVQKGTAITTKNRDAWLKLGMVDPSKVNINPNTNQVTSVQQGAIAGSNVIGVNFKQWVDEYLRQAFNAAGIDMNDSNAIKQEVSQLFPNRNAANKAFKLLAPDSKELIEKDVKNIDQTAGRDEQVSNGQKLSAANWERFNKSVHDLGIAIGTTLLPVLNPLIEGFTKLLELFGQFAQNHPILAHLAVLTVAIGGVSLAISGMKNVFGVFGSLTEAFLGVAKQSRASATVVEGAAATTRAAAVKTAATSELFGGLGTAFARLGGAVTTAAGVIARGFLRLIPWVGALLIAWDLAALIGNLEIGGHKISDWASSLADKVANAFQNMWVRTKQYFGFLTKDAADAQVEANNRANAKKQAALGFGPKKAAAPQTGGASGDWGRGEEISPESKAVEDQIKQKKAIDAQLAANKAGAEGLGGGKKKRGRFANYDADLDEAKNDLRLEEDELARHMKAEDELYKAQKISIDEYYNDKLATMRKSVGLQIAELEREKAAYEKQGDKAGVNRATTEIELRRRDLADNEKSVEVQREKDLNALKERGLQLEAQILQAEGKRSQAELAREIQRLEKEKREYLLNPNAPDSAKNAASAQHAIDIAKLTLAWEQYGDVVKKIHEDTQTREAEVDAEVKSGQLTKYQAEQKIFTLRQQEAQQLDELIAKERALIEASDAPQGVKDQRLKTLDLSQARARATLSEMSPEDMRIKQTLDNNIEGGFANFFNSVISRSKSASDAIRDFGESIKSTFTKLISEELGRSLFQSLFGSGGVNMGSGGGLNSIFSFFGNMFGGGGGSGVMSSGEYAAGNLLSFAVGTDEVPQDMIAQIHQGEMIVPKYDAERLRNLPSGGQANAAPPAVTLQIHPDALHMKLSDWLDGELARQMATR